MTAQAQADGFEEVALVATAIRRDLLSLLARTNDLAIRALLRLLNLSCCLTPAGLAVMRRRDHDSYDWLLWGLTDDWAVDGAGPEPTRLERFARSGLPGASEDIVAPYLSSLLDYDSRTAGLRDMAIQCLPPAARLATSRLALGDPALAVAVLNWAGRTRDRSDDHWTRLPEVGGVADGVRVLADTGMPSTAHRTAVRMLATGDDGVTGEVDPAARARQLLDTYQDLDPVERLQATVVLAGADGAAVLARLDELIEQTRALREQWTPAQSQARFLVPGPPNILSLASRSLHC